MSVRLSGDTVIQEGKISDFSVLADIPNTTVVNVGGRTIYIIPYKLNLTDDWRIEPEKEGVVIDYPTAYPRAMLLGGKGTIVGRAQDKHVAFAHKDTTSPTHYRTAISITGQITGKGLVIESGRQVVLSSKANIDVDYFYITSLTTSTNVNLGNITVKAKEFIIYGRNFFGSLSSNSNVSLFGQRDSGGIYTRFNTNDGSLIKWFEYLNYRNDDSASPLFMGYSHQTRLINPYKVYSTTNTFSSVRVGIYEFIRQLHFTLVTQESQPITGAKILIQDYNTGAVRYTNSEVRDYTQKHHLVYSTDAQGIASFQYTYGVTLNNANNTNPVTFYRTQGQTPTLKAVLISYAHNTGAVGADLLGNGMLTIEQAMTSDPNISESDQDLVANYTLVDNLDQLYDLAKWWKVEHTNLLYPSQDELLISAHNDALNFGDRNLIVDDEAGPPLEVDTVSNTITLKASILSSGLTFSSILTTGTISTRGNAKVDVPYVDRTQDTAVTFKGVDSWKVYASEYDRKHNQNLIAEGTGSWGFVHPQTPTTYYAILLVGGEGFLKQFTIADKGRHTIELSTLSLLNSIDLATKSLAGKVDTELVQQIKTELERNGGALDTINEGVKKTSLGIPYTKNIN